MKKNALILTLALLIALPVFGLAAGLATVPTDETQSTPPYGFTDEDNNGFCDVCGNEQGKNTGAPNFTDADGDGVCDHLGTQLQGQGNGGMQKGQGRGNQGASKGQSFVDADGDGACDNLGTDLQGQGQGQQSRGGGRGRR